MDCPSLRPRSRFAAISASMLVAAFATIPTPASAQSSLEYLPSGQTVSGISFDGTTIFGVEDGSFGTRTFVRRGGSTSTFMVAGGAFTVPSGASGNGATVVGRGEVAGGSTQAFVWRAGDVSPTLLAPDSLSSNANAVSRDDGSTIVGAEEHAWGVGGLVVRNGVRLTLDFGGGFTILYGVSGDGTTVAGTTIMPGETNPKAFVWRIGDPAPTFVPFVDPLNPDTYSEALNVSADGSTVVGWRVDAGLSTAFVWRIGDAASSLVNLGGMGSTPGAVTPNGSTAVGQVVTSAGLLRGFASRNGALEVLEPPAGRQYSTATLVSADGSRIVGFAWNDETDTVDFDGMDVVVWDAGQPPRFLKDMLSAHGVTIGARLRLALSMSGDGTRFVGESFLRTPLLGGGFSDVFGSYSAVLTFSEPAPDPSAMILELIAKVKRSNVQPIVKIPLAAKLYAAYIAVELDAPWLAKVILKSFIAQVDSNSPRRIPAALADEWTDDAEDIIDALSH